jgi:hypothetical protein
MRKVYIIGAMTCLFAACRPSVNITTKATAGDAVFTNYLAVGNSLTAGYSDGSLTVTGQLNSYPQRLFEQFSLVGAKGPFIQPLVEGDFGYPFPKKVLALLRNPCNYNDSFLGPVDNYGSPDTLGSYTYTSPVNNGQINNIGVPGIRMVDYPVVSYPIYAATPLILGFPYAQRFYHDVNNTPLHSLPYGWVPMTCLAMRLQVDRVTVQDLPHHLRLTSTTQWISALPQFFNVATTLQLQWR